MDKTSYGELWSKRVGFYNHNYHYYDNYDKKNIRIWGIKLRKVNIIVRLSNIIRITDFLK